MTEPFNSGDGVISSNTGISPPADPASFSAPAATKPAAGKSGHRAPQSPRSGPPSRKQLIVGVIGLVAVGVVAGAVGILTSSSGGTPSATGVVGGTGTAAGGQQPVPGGGAQALSTAGGSVPGPMPGAPSHPAQSGSATSPASTTPTSPAAPPSGPKPLKPTDPTQVKSWNSSQAGKTMALITTQAGSILMSHGSGQYPQMLQACKTLSSDLQTAANLPTIPDAKMRTHYQKALNEFAAGVTQCESGISQHQEGAEDVVTQVNQTDIKAAVKKFGTGMTDLYIATGYLRKS
jgi:hypothetical protein